MSKHTPGPWEIYTHNPDGSGLHIKSTKGGVIAKLFNPGLREMLEANARLIAAAPELLDACEDVLYGINHKIDDNAIKRMTNWLQQAISKAKGE
jgi:hypothetical protein